MKGRDAKIALVQTILTAGVGLLLTGALLRNASASETAACVVPSAGYPTIQSAVNNPACHVVDLVSSDYTGSTIIDRSVTIQGQGLTTTVVSGQGTTRPFAIEPGTGPVTLANMTIEQGNAFEGGGIYHAGDELLLSAMAITGNRASRGGGVYVSEGGQLTIVDSTFRNNEGWVMVGALMAMEADVTVLNSSFEENESTFEAGAILSGPGSILTIDGTTFRANTAGGSGGAIVSQYATLHAQNSSFLDNSSLDYGGGIVSWASAATFSETLFVGNHSTEGGALYLTAYGTASISSSIFMNNRARNGGAIENFSAVMTLTNSTLSSNYADGGAGGGIYSRATVTIDRSTLSQNQTLAEHSGSKGGAVFQDGGELTILDSLLYENKSGDTGGAIYAEHGASNLLVNSTLAGNTAGYAGGALFLDHADTMAGLVNTTIVSNTVTGVGSSGGGGIFNSNWNGSSTLALVNSIVAGNEPQDCAGPAPIASLGYNLDSDDTCNLVEEGDLPDTDPMLGPLADNGGPSLTHALLPGSPAVDGGDNFFCPETDQRGLPRPRDGDDDGVSRCDIGAVELQPPPKLIFLPLLGRSP